MYIVVNCPHCGSLMVARAENRTRSCPRCNHRADLRGLRIVARAETAREASAILRALKAKEGGEEGCEPRFKRFVV